MDNRHFRAKIVWCRRGAILFLCRRNGNKPVSGVQREITQILIKYPHDNGTAIMYRNHHDDCHGNHYPYHNALCIYLIRRQQFGMLLIWR